jgi:hypothetical protein
LPAPVFSKATAIASKAMGVGGGAELPKKSAAMYGLMAQLPNRGDVQSLVIDALDQLLRYKAEHEIQIISEPVTQDEPDVIPLHKNTKSSTP